MENDVVYCPHCGKANNGVIEYAKTLSPAEWVFCCEHCEGDFELYRDTEGKFFIETGQS